MKQHLDIHDPQHEDNDDEMVGSIISRRAALRLFGAAAGGGALLGATKLIGANAQTTSPTSSSSGLPSCIVRPAMTEGPYFVDEKLNRSDVRSDPATKTVRPGAALRLTFLVSSVSTKGCQPLEGATVDIWQCDASGTYSDVQGAVGQKFLRGSQVSNAKGQAQFLTIYPGWYPGRTVHIHFKIRHGTGSAQKEFTSQLFFDDTFTDAVYKTAPYNARGARNTRNNADGIYKNGGSQLLLETKADGKGYAATFDIGLNLG
jgi:protocatechuate 3,4-dioxygenase beta subunit